GVVLHDLRRLAPAERALRDALDLIDRLVVEQPASAEYRELQGTAASNLGDLLKDIGQEKEVEAALRRAIAIREKLLVEQPKSILARMSLAHSWLKLGAVLHSRGLAE